MTSGGQSENKRIPLCPSYLPSDCKRLGVERSATSLHKRDMVFPISISDPSPSDLESRGVRPALEAFQRICRSKRPNSEGNYAIFVCKKDKEEFGAPLAEVLPPLPPKPPPPPPPPPTPESAEPPPPTAKLDAGSPPLLIPSVDGGPPDAGVQDASRAVCPDPQEILRLQERVRALEAKLAQESSKPPPSVSLAPQDNNKGRFLLLAAAAGAVAGAAAVGIPWAIRSRRSARSYITSPQPSLPGVTIGLADFLPREITETDVRRMLLAHPKNLPHLNGDYLALTASNPVVVNKLVKGVQEVYNENPLLRKKFPLVHKRFHHRFLEIAIAVVREDRNLIANLNLNLEEDPLFEEAWQKRIASHQGPPQQPPPGTTGQARRARNLRRMYSRSRSRARIRRHFQQTRLNTYPVTLPRTSLLHYAGGGIFLGASVGLDVAEYYGMISSRFKTGIQLIGLGLMQYFNRYAIAEFGLLAAPFAFWRWTAEENLEALGVEKGSLGGIVGANLGGAALTAGFVKVTGGYQAWRHVAVGLQNGVRNSFVSVGQAARVGLQTYGTRAIELAKMAAPAATVSVAALKGGTVVVGEAIAASAAATAVAAVAVGGVTFAAAHYSGFGEWAGENLADAAIGVTDWLFGIKRIPIEKPTQKTKGPQETPQSPSDNLLV